MSTAEPNSIFLFYGEDSFSSSQKILLWKKEFIKKFGDDSIETIDGKSLNPSEFSTNIEAIPFLSEKRLIIVNDFLEKGKTDNQKQVADNLSKATDQCIILFHENKAPDKRTVLFKRISKLGKIEEFRTLTPPEVSKWITERAKKENIKIDFGTINYLSEHCGPSLWTISSELEKLKIYASGKEISKEMIDEVATQSLSSSIFKLTDSVAQKNVKESLKTFGILNESGEDLMMIFFMLVRHFRILLQVHEMLSKGEKPFSITKKLRQHPFVIQKTSNQSKNFNQRKLEEIYRMLLDIDIKVKTGKIKSYGANNKEFALAIEQLIINCCKKD